MDVTRTRRTGLRRAAGEAPAPSGEHRFLRRRSRARRVVVAATAAVLAGVVAVLAPSTAGALSSSRRPPSVSSSPAGGVHTTAETTSIQLAAGIPWLTGTNKFHLAVSLQSPLPPADLEVSLQLYPNVTGRSAFDQALGGSPVANVLEAQLIPLSALGVDGATGGTSATVSMTLPVTTKSAAPPHQTAAAPALTLECDVRQGPCDGVYPIEVALVDRADVPLSSFTTFLVYAEKLQNALPMRVGWTLPLGGSPTLDAAGQPVLDAADEESLADTVRDLDLYPKVGVTLETYGETIDAIASGIHSSYLLPALRALAASPSRQIVGATFSPVDVGQFAHAGIAGELAVQLQAGEAALHAVLGPTVPLSTSSWVLGGSIDQPTMSMLISQGVRQLVLPEAALAPSSWKYTPTEPFTLRTGSPVPTGVTGPGTTGTGTTGIGATGTGATGTGATGTGATGTGATGTGKAGVAGGPPAISGPSVDAISADAGLSAHFQNSGDPVLQGENLLADLAEIYFEEPYAYAPTAGGGVEYQPRSVVVQTPTSWKTDDSMLRVVLAGLDQARQEGILLPTTVSGLFAGDPPGADGEPVNRYLAPGKTSSTSSRLTPSVISGARADIAAFASLNPSDTTKVAALEQDVLGGEASDITPAASTALFSLPAAAIASDGAEVSLPQGPIVTLTSSTGRVPITIESRSNQPLHVRLVLSAPDSGVRFPSGSSFTIVVSHGTTVQDVQINTLTSGDFGLRLDLVTPVGAVVLGRGNVTIRSTALSGLAIGLSAGALVLLVVWWIRSSRRRRRALAAAAAVAVGAEPTDE